MISKKVPQNLLLREILPQLKKNLDLDEITLLIGPRQSGKTSLMFLLLEFLQKEKQAPPEQIFYLDLENILFVEQLNKIKDFEQFARNLEAEGADLGKRSWVFIDEIQYLDHPSGFLKYLYDHYKGKIKFVVSGSSSLEIKQKFTDRLTPLEAQQEFCVHCLKQERKRLIASVPCTTTNVEKLLTGLTGRVHPFVIHPLSFYEYLYFIQEKHLSQLKQANNLFSFIKGSRKPELTQTLIVSLQEHFEKFAVFGGYPGVSLKKDESGRIEDLANIYSLYVRKDIKDIGHIEDIKGFNNLVGMLAHQIGSLVNETELSIGTGLSRTTIKKYLALLENTFVCYLLRPFFTNARLEYSKMPKVYFADPGLRNAAVNSFDSLDKRGDIGHLIENVVFAEILKKLPQLWEIHFWRSERGAEVDFVLKGEGQKVIPVEVKYQSFNKPKIPSGLRSFIKRYQPEKALVVTKDFWAEETIDQTQIYWLPAWMV